MVITRNPVKPMRHLHFNGINHVSTVDSEAEVFRAYVEFAFHHTQNDVEAYEIAVSDSTDEEQKLLFVQLACRKREVIDKLKMHRPGSSLANGAEKGRSGESSLEKRSRQEHRTLITMNDALDFACQRENRTLELYDKLAKTAHLSSVQVLFDYLLESQRHHLTYLATQCAVAQCAS